MNPAASLFFLLFLIPSLVFCQTVSEIERINFFPRNPSFVSLGYNYQKIRISTPQISANAKTVNNYTNIFKGSYAYKIQKSLFLGGSLYFESSSENGVFYGTPSTRRTTSLGTKEPEFFSIYRLKEQKNTSGLVDLLLTFSPRGGLRRTGKDGGNRRNGRNIGSIGISHGLWEEEWEFKTGLTYTYFGEGKEVNGPDQLVYDLESYFNIIVSFQTQYRINESSFVLASIGVEYKGTQDISQRGPDGNNIEVQNGTASIFGLGYKHCFGSRTVFNLNYSLERNDYFVKGAPMNIEGKYLKEIFSLNLLRSF